MIGAVDPELGGPGDRDECRRRDGLTSVEREELAKLRRECVFRHRRNTHRENRQLKLEREILAKKSRGLVRTGDLPCATEIFEFVKANRANYPVATQRRVPAASPRRLLWWLDRAPSARRVTNEVLLERIREIHGVCRALTARLATTRSLGRRAGASAASAWPA